MSNYGITSHISVRGKCKWAHVVRLNRYDDWSIDLWPDSESLELLRELQSKGMKNTIRKDEDGYNIRFKRSPKKEVTLRSTKQTKVLTFPPPTVAMADGSPLPHGVSIGNGSDVTVLLEVYPHGTPNGGRAVAARLEGVRVDNLIPFDPQVDYAEHEKDAVERLMSQPEPIF